MRRKLARCSETTPLVTRLGTGVLSGSQRTSRRTSQWTGNMGTSETIKATGDTVRAEIIDGIADVRLNRPEKLNALSQDVFADLLEMGVTIRRRSDVRAVVLS